MERDRNFSPPDPVIDTMPKITAATSHLAVRAKLAIGLTLALGAVAALPSPALASHSQIAIIQDGSDLGNAPAAMAQFRMLGANTVRVVVWWYLLAPHPGSTHRPRHFNATDPNAYSNRDWAPYDSIVQAAAADGMSVDLTVSGGAPRWAEASKPPHTPHTTPGAIAWRPNAKQYGEFVQAVGKRYSGHFTPRGASSPLPRVHFWALFNEPNFGEDLGPQATHGSRVATAPAMYRALAGAGWRGLRASGHRHDTILIGELAAQGEEPSRPTRHAPQGYPGNLGQTRPLLFIRDLYCVSSSFRPLRGAAARAAGCPTSRGAQRR
ncbi:MAG: hypothetical protein ACRDSS_09875, partial [Actinocrinis sp.]